MDNVVDNVMDNVVDNVVDDDVIQDIVQDIVEDVVVEQTPISLYNHVDQAGLEVRNLVYTSQKEKKAV